jgi:hypothetical protein
MKKRNAAANRWQGSRRALVARQPEGRSIDAVCVQHL